jgi:hypothetical protein
VTATTTTLSASATQINVGQSVTFNVTVAATAGAAPAGNVTLLDGSTSLGTASLSNSAASFTITSLAAGSHSITASYAGDSTDGSSTSSAVSVQVNGPQLPTTTVTFTASPTTAVAGQTVSLTANVAPTSGTSSPTGTVTFQDGTTAIGSSPLAGASGALAVSTLSVGTHSLSAVYSGDAAHAASTSQPVTVIITAATPPPGTPVADYGFTLSGSTLTMTQGTSGSLMVSVAPENGFNASLSFACTGLPSGAACSFAPPTLSGSAPESTKMTIGAANSSQLIQAPAGLVWALVLPAPLCFLGLSGGKLRWTQWVLLFLLVLALAGCGTSFNGSQPGQSSTYNVTVTASGTSAPTHTQTFVLTMTPAQ